ncbi:MAG: DnaJ domain-containing protein [Cytophagaceae bacterium]|nr:DnaJ domain-containing protein [Cytophagaceae bacterium]
MPVTYYDILGIPATATQEQIKAAYKKLAKIYHPDKNQGSKYHEEQFKKINEAYQTLSDVKKKYIYDQQLLNPFFTTYTGHTTPPNTSVKKHKARQNTHYTYVHSRPKKPNYFNLKINVFTCLYYFIMIMLVQFLYDYLRLNKANKYFAEASELHQYGYYDHAYEKYAKAVELNPKLFEAHKAMYRIDMLQRHDYKQAITKINNCLLLFDTEKDTLYFDRSMCHLKLNLKKLALKDLDSALFFNSRLDSAYYYRADILFEMGNYDMAITDYGRFLTFKFSEQALLKQGLCYYYLTELPKAIHTYSALIKQKPKMGEAYYYRGMAHLSLQDTASACKDFTSSLTYGFELIKDRYNIYCD